MKEITDLLTGICVASFLIFLAVVFIGLMFLFKYYDEDLERRTKKQKAQKEKDYEELRAKILCDIERRERKMK